MREFKFRAWNGQQMDYDYRDASLWNGLLVAEGDTILMQFTGLKDKHGKEIYEDDIVVVWNIPESVKSIVRIGESEIEVDIYDDSISRPYYGVYLEGSIDLEPFLLRGEMEVIGNSYENPELLDLNQPWKRN